LTADQRTLHAPGQLVAGRRVSASGNHAVRRGTTIAVALTVRLRLALPFVLVTALARAETKLPAPAAPPEPDENARPGERAFLGCKKYPPDKRFRWNVKSEVGVDELVASLAELSCLRIVVGGGIGARAGKVHLEAPDLLTPGEIYRLFHTALETLGLTVEETARTLKVVDAGRAREVARPLDADEETPAGDLFVTRLRRLKHAAPAELVEILGRLKSKEGEVAAYARTGALLLTDRAQVVRRMEALVEVLDVPPLRPGDRVFSLSTFRHAPSDLALTLERVLGAGRGTAPAAGGKGAPAAPSGGPLSEGVTALVPVDAARLLLVVGSDAGFRRLVALARRVDPDDGGDASGEAHVVYLAHTNAKDIATTLKDLGLGQAGAPAGGKPGTPSSGALPLEGQVRVAADEVANAIVVVASQGDFRLVRDLITRLDVPRRQVYIEATILDISIERSRALGLSFHQGTANDQGAGMVSSGSKGVSSLVVDAAALAALFGSGGLTAGFLGSGFNIAGQSIPSFGVVLKALAQNKDVHVISRPHVLTLDNVKAHLSVGQQIPYRASSLAAAGGTSTQTVLATTQFKPVELKMDLTPHLNQSVAVRLEIDGQISDVPDGTSLLDGAPTTNNRELKTTVLVHSGESVVLGGLQKETLSDTVDKIPFLGDIPILGKLFQTRSKQRKQQDLLIVLTPHIIHGPDDLRRIHAQRQKEQDEFLERMSAFKGEARRGSIDYHTRRGLLEEVNQTSLLAERDAEAVRQARRALAPRRAPDGPVEPEPES
jgi:general secretion pathway protein D